MPAIGPVYQPTTYNVGYEPQTEWPQQPRRSRWTKFVDWLQSEDCCRRTFLGSCCIIILFILIIVLDFVVSLISGRDVIIQCDDPVYSIILYICFTIVAIACITSLVLIYLRFMRNKRFYFWPFVQKESLARQMGSQGRNGQAMVLNPSTDLLVTPAQYGPVMEAPPTMHEEDETRNLMCSDTKELNEDHEDRSAVTDPRIVLQPPGHLDDL